MGCYIILAQQIGEVARHAFDEPPSIDENQRRFVFPDQISQPPVDLIPNFGRHYGFERCIRHFQGQITGALVSRIDDDGSTLSRVLGADQKARNLFDRFLRGRKTDTQQTIAAEVVKPLKG